MNALQSYYSDDSDDGKRTKKISKTADPDTNYDDVGMDISEESDGEEQEKNVSSSSPKPVEKGSPSNIPPRSKADSKQTSRSRQSPERHPNSREGSSSSGSRDSRDDKEHRKNQDSRERRKPYHEDRRDRRDRDDYRSGRKRRERSRSRERRHRRSRSRSRSRSRERYRHDRRKLTDMRKEAQQKLVALKTNPNFDQSEMLRRTMKEQVVEIEKKTGITLPSYYNPATMNPLKLAEQERKKRLLWGNKTKAPQAEAVAPVAEPKPAEPAGQNTVWANTSFINDQDGKMAEKFKRLMGVKATAAGSSDGSSQKEDKLKEQESFFVNMERQYEVARIATHTQKGVGLGFSSQSYLPK